MKSESPPIFSDCFAPMVSALAFVVASLVLFASLLFFVGFSWVVGCVVGASFSLRMIATKRKGAPRWCVLSLFVACGLVISLYSY